MFHPSRGGVRGGKDQFNWDDVKSDKDRDFFLGHSVKAPVGRWQKGKDLTWYAKGKQGSSAIGPSKMDDEERKREVQRVKEEEEQAMMEMLGLAKSRRRVNTAQGSLDKREAEALFKKGSVGDAVGEQFAEGERVKGVGFGVRQQMLAAAPSSKEGEEKSTPEIAQEAKGDGEGGGPGTQEASSLKRSSGLEVVNLEAGKRKRGKETKSKKEDKSSDSESSSSSESESSSSSSSSSDSEIGDEEGKGAKRKKGEDAEGKGEEGSTKSKKERKRDKKREKRREKRRLRREEELAAAKGVSEKRLRRRRREMRLERKKARREVRRTRAEAEKAEHYDTLGYRKEGERDKEREEESEKRGGTSFEDMFKSGRLMADRDLFVKERQGEMKQQRKGQRNMGKQNEEGKRERAGGEEEGERYGQREEGRREMGRDRDREIHEKRGNGRSDDRQHRRW